MNDIIVDITEVVDRQKKSNKYNIRLAVLIIGIVVLLAIAAGMLLPTLTTFIPEVASISAILPPWYVFAAIAGVAAIGFVFIYNLPSARDKKFNEPFITTIRGSLTASGYVFDDEKKKETFDPWLSSLSKYLHGPGVKIKPNMMAGRKARSIKFLKNNIPVLLSAERMGTRGSVLLHIVEVDSEGALLFNEIDDEDFGDTLNSQQPMQQAIASQPLPQQSPVSPQSPAAAPPAVPPVVTPTPVVAPPVIPSQPTVVPITPPPVFNPPSSPVRPTEPPVI